GVDRRGRAGRSRSPCLSRARRGSAPGEESRPAVRAASRADAREEAPMLRQVAPGVLVHQSELLQNNTVVVEGRTGVLLVDPGLTVSEMTCLADDLRELGRPVVAGFSTHPDWDHVLWHPVLGDVPRYGTARCAAAMRDLRSHPGWRERVLEALPPEIADETPLDGFGLVTALPAGSARVPWDGPTCASSSTRRTRPAMPPCSSRGAASSPPATCCPTSSSPCSTTWRRPTTRSRSTSWASGCSTTCQATSPSSSRATGPSAGPTRSVAGSTWTAPTCTPCATGPRPTTRGSARRPGPAGSG